MRHAPYLLPGLLLGITSAQAVPLQDLFTLSLEELGRIEVSIATGTPKALVAAPAVTTVITARELEAMGAQDIGEALEAVPGLHVSNGSFTSAPRYFIRGIVSAYNPHTLVLINGVPQTSLFLGDRGERLANVYSLPVKLIDRIEIIRGPGSAMYGADAFSGVVNVITKSPLDVHGGQFSASAGSFGTYRASVLQEGELGPARGLLSLAWMQTEGDRSAIITRDAQTNIDALGLAPPASLAPGPVENSIRNYDIRSDLVWGDFRLRLGWMKAWDVGTGQGINDALDPQSRFLYHRGNAELGWHDTDLFPEWTLEARLSYLYSDFENPSFIRLFPPGAFFGSFPQGVIGTPNLYEENARADFSALHSGRGKHRVRLGSGFFWGDIFRTRDVNNYLIGNPPTPRPALTDISDTPAMFQPEQQRTSYYAFLQDEWALAQDWELTAGLRYDHYSDVGGTTNPRLALVWKTTPTLTTKLLYGEAFRPPAFLELYGSSNPVALGNPDLEPERLQSLELALNWRPTTSLHWDSNVYEYRIRDFIDFVADPGQATFTARNARRIEGQGIETELRYQVNEELQVLANYSHQRTRDQGSGEPLGLAPSDQASMRATWGMAPGWMLTPQLTWVGERKRQAGDPRDDLEGYVSTDVVLRRAVTADFDFTLTARNLFNADAREATRGPEPGQLQPNLPDDLPQAGRSVSVEANIRW